MSKSFKEDPAGVILEYAFLTQQSSNSKIVEKDSWIKNHNKKNKPHSWNNFLEPDVIKNILDLNSSESRIFGRVIRKLVDNDLIEPYPNELSSPKHFTITALGEEIFREGSYLEFMGELNFVVKKWKNSIAKIYRPNDEGIGTGFLIDKDMIATAKHVVEELKTFHIKFEDSNDVFKSKDDPIISKKMDDLDLAIIKLDKSVNDRQPFKLSMDYDLLDDIVIFGYPPIPQSKGAYLVVNKGEISSEAQLYTTDLQCIIISTLTRGGYSGGPIVNRRGQVIGILTEYLFKKLYEIENGLNEGIGYSCGIPVQWLKDLKDGII